MSELKASIQVQDQSETFVYVVTFYPCSCFTSLNTAQALYDLAVAGFTILVWDHAVTFDDEVELIWKRDKGLLAYLFLLNRYLIPLGFIVNLVAYTLTSWGEKHADRCQRFVRYEGAMTVIGTQVAGFIMFLRVRALYNRKQAVIWSTMLLFLIWLGMNAWLLTHGQAVPHTSGLHSCTMIFEDSIGNIASASAWLPLLYDTYVFALTLSKTRRRTGHIVKTMLSDGILYYVVICMVNIVLTVMIVRAGDDLKNITAQLELLLTVAMVSRITLNLRKQALEERETMFTCGDDWVALRRIQTQPNAGLNRPRRTVTIPRRSSTVRGELYVEQLRLGTVIDIRGDMSPIASPVGDEAPRLSGSEV